MIKPSAVLFALLASLLVTTAARAQSANATADVATSTAPSSPTGTTTDSVTAGPTLAATTVGFRSSQTATQPVASDALARQGIGRAETFMIVGGAAFVAGILIGDDAGTLLMVGGAVMGLYGLWVYLQQH